MRGLMSLHQWTHSARLRCGGCGRSSRSWWRRSGIHIEGLWYCGAECAARGIEQRMLELLHLPSSTTEHPRRLPLGLLLYSRGCVTQQALQAALAAQRSGTPLRIGEWLHNNGLIHERQLTSALAAQWACPVVVTESRTMDCARLVPRALLLASHMLPARISGRPPVLHVAFSRQIDRSALSALERMLRCRVEPCVMAESSLASALQALEAMGKLEREAEFNDRMPAVEMSRVVSSYAAQTEAGGCRIVNCRRHLWVRLEGHRGMWDICFRTPAP